MTQLHPVTVKILDKDYHIACPAAERANLESAARFLDEKMRAVRDAGKVFGVERIAVLTALNLSYETLQNQPGNSGQERASREHASDLLERIDRALHGDDPALRRQQLRQEQAARNAQLNTRPQVSAPTPVASAPVSMQVPAVEVPAAAEPFPALQQESPRQMAPWEQAQPEPQVVPEPQEYSYAPEQESQDNWSEQQQNQAPLPQHDWSQQNNGNGGFNNGR